MKKFLLVSLGLLVLGVLPSRAFALDCNPNDSSDSSRSCVVSILCNNNQDLHESQGCQTPAGCSAPAPEPCAPGTSSSTNAPASFYVPPAGQNFPNTTIPNYTIGSSTTTTAPNSASCNFDAAQKDSYFQQNVTGATPIVDMFLQPVSTTYNSTYYATDAAAQALAKCLGGTVVSVPSNFQGGFTKPPTLEIKLPNGYQENAGYLIDRYFGNSSSPNYWSQVGRYGSGQVNTGGVNLSSVGGTGGTGASRGATSGASAIAQSISVSQASQLISTIQSIIESYKQTLAKTIASSGTGTSGTTPSSGSTATTITSVGNLGPSRYIQVDSNNSTGPCNIAGTMTTCYLFTSSWIAWREIQIYDDKGNLLKPVSCTPVSSTDILNNVTKCEQVYDGNVNTVWNSGYYFGTITLDLGSNKSISKIRLLTENTPNPATPIHKLSAKADGASSYTLIKTFSGKINSNTWLEYP